MKILTVLSIFTLFLSCQESKKEIALLGQWHLLSNQKTLDIEKSKALPQYINQKALYLILDEWVSSQKIDLILSEGCEKIEVTKKFKPNFNGWDYNLLKEQVNNKEYESILSLLPLKIEAKHNENIKVQCADSFRLIRKHQLVFSDIKGHLGFLTRLIQAKKENNQKLFKTYKDKLVEINKVSIDDPVSYCRNKIKELLKEEKKLIELRNEYFIKTLLEHDESKVAIIIGHRHIKHLEKRLKELGHNVVIPPIIATTLPKIDLELKLLESIKAQ